MKTYKVDLHNHTPLIPNDYKGRLDTSGIEILNAALSAGIDVLAISDHFSVDFFRNVFQAAEDIYASTGQKMLVVPGSELKITWMGEEVHIITLLPPEKAEQIFEELMSFLGVSSSERVTENLPRLTVEFDPVQVIKKVSSLGGMSHIAHVDRYFGNYRLMDRPVIDRLIKEAPISAVEIIEKQNGEILRRRTNGIPHIQSSDSHSLDEVGRRCCELYMHDLSFESLNRALSHNENRSTIYLHPRQQQKGLVLPASKCR